MITLISMAVWSSLYYMHTNNILILIIDILCRKTTKEIRIIELHKLLLLFAGKQLKDIHHRTTQTTIY